MLDYKAQWSAFVDANAKGLRFRDPDEAQSEFIRQHVTYNSETGELRYKGRPGRLQVGYIYFSINRRTIKASRLAWFMHYGVWPGRRVVDHRDGDTLNDRISNLRLATNGQNLSCRKPRKDNTSGHRGVHRCNGWWYASISVDGSCRRIARFDDFEEAVACYVTVSEQLYGGFGRVD